MTGRELRGRRRKLCHLHFGFRKKEGRLEGGGGEVKEDLFGYPCKMEHVHFGQCF